MKCIFACMIICGIYLNHLNFASAGFHFAFPGSFNCKALIIYSRRIRAVCFHGPYPTTLHFHCMPTDICLFASLLHIMYDLCLPSFRAVKALLIDLPLHVHSHRTNSYAAACESESLFQGGWWKKAPQDILIL